MPVTFDLKNISDAEKSEMEKLGILMDDTEVKEYTIPEIHDSRPYIPKFAVHAPGIINEAFDYSRPSSFSRALKFEIGGYRVVLISGTASVNEEGKAVHIGDFRAQCWRMFRNITQLLSSEDMTWHDIVRTTCYLRDIERDYKDFNEIRTTFYNWMKLDPLPASTGIQARLCWETLLVETEAIAVCPLNRK
jgi:enamine deaminase RidA (YjgF/YER057c/UK114 family)